MALSFSEVLYQEQNRLLHIAQESGERWLSAVSEMRHAVDHALRQQVNEFSKEELIRLQSALHELIGKVLEDRVTLRIQQLTELARHDGLTGLLNRAAFDARLIEEIARAKRYGRDLTLVMFDVDDFKSVNDSHGHQAGDRVLIGVAVALQSSFRQSDLVFRYGGDEFAVLCPETTGAAIETALRRIATQLPVFNNEDGFAHRVSVSWGIAWLPTNATNAAADELIRLADQRLYQCKRANSEQR
ncbi:MAG: GGDEF domain-containing protein [Blastocatellia bacterium]